MKISFVLPMYNEALNIGAMVEMIRREAAPLLEEYEIVITDDCSTDGCGDIADRIAADDPRVHVIHHPRNRGLGASIRSAIAASTMPWVLYCDSDLPVDLASLRSILPQVTPETDVLIGYRLSRTEGAWRIIMSRLYNLLISIISGWRVRDVDFAFKLMRSDMLKRFDLRSEGSFIDAEILLEARRTGCRIVEVGVEYRLRQAGVASLSWFKVARQILKELWTYLRRDCSTAFRGIIINGDDFGIHPAVNTAIIDAYHSGVLTSASIIAGGDAFNDAVAKALDEPDLQVGVHLALTHVSPCAPCESIPHLVDTECRLPTRHRPFLWRLLRRQIPADEVEHEFRAQIERVQAAGLTISHLNSHQHIHAAPMCAEIVAKLAREYGIPAVRLPRKPLVWHREHGLPGGMKHLAQAVILRILSCKVAGVLREAGVGFPDRCIDIAHVGPMDRILASEIVKARDGITEIAYHPGASTVEPAASFDSDSQPEKERDVLCSCETRVALARSKTCFVPWSTCRPKPVLPLWTRFTTAYLAHMPLYPLFGILALASARPLDQADPTVLYASAGVGIAVTFGLLSWLFNGCLHTAIRALAVTGVYAGLVLLSNSFWMAVFAVPIAAVNLLWIIRRRTPCDDRARRVSLVASMIVLLLIPCFVLQGAYHRTRHRNDLSLLNTVHYSDQHPSSTHRHSRDGRNATVKPAERMHPGGT